MRAFLNRLGRALTGSGEPELIEAYAGLAERVVPTLVALMEGRRSPIPPEWIGAANAALKAPIDVSEGTKLGELAATMMVRVDVNDGPRRLRFQVVCLVGKTPEAQAALEAAVKPTLPTLDQVKE